MNGPGRGAGATAATSPEQVCVGIFGQVDALAPGAGAVEPIHLFDLAAKQAHWLSTGQAVIANNVANVNTPGFHARTVQPFAQVLDHTQLSLASTNSAHMAPTAADQQAASIREDEPWETSTSGNTVSLEQELIKAGDVNRTFSLNTSLVKAFHSMLLASVRS